MARTWEAPDGIAVFVTPEEAALSQWANVPSAQARVAEVRPAADEGVVWVSLQLDGTPGFHDLDVINCMQTADGRWWAGSSTGADSR
jgi:hypothetical protein